MQFYGSDDKLLHFRIPPDLKPASYTVWVHNGLGGEYGWRPAGRIRVNPQSTPPAKLFNVRDFGAVGDGLAIDTPALAKALDAAQAAGGIVYLPPGTYAVNETLSVPAGVRLRGSAKGNTVIAGVGYQPHTGRRAWYSTDELPYSVLLLASNTGLDSLTVKGVVAKGAGGTGLVEIVAVGGEGADRVAIQNCALESQAIHPDYGTQLYRDGIALHSQVHVSRLQLKGNTLAGGISLRATISRGEITDNTVLGGGFHASAFQTLMDANIFRDGPSRILFYPRRHCYVRFTESHNYGRLSWNNFPETFLAHGGSAKTTSTPSAVGPASLTDSHQQWKPGQYRDATLLISAGTGFGQYRRVLDNDANTLTLESPWRVKPDSSSEYVVGNFFVENAYSGNLNVGPGWFSLWLDCICNVVEKHRDAFAGGVNTWGRDLSVREKDGKITNQEMLTPSWYNMFCNNWLDGSTVELVGPEKPENAYRCPVLFANYVLRNKVRQPHMKRIPLDYKSHEALGGIALLKLWAAWGIPSVEERATIRERDSQCPRAGRARTSHTVIANNFVSFTHAGIVVHNHARKTFVLNNEFQEVRHPILNWGHETVSTNNSLLILDDQGERRELLP
jgi:hypothetical protein